MNPEPKASGSVAARRLSAGCNELSALLEALAATDVEATDGTLVARVHAARKLGKSLRGGFALFDLEKSAGRGIQAVGRLLAAARDAVSRRVTWHRLDWNDGSLAATAIVALLDRQMTSTVIPPPPEVIDWCRGRVAGAADAIDTLDPATLDERASSGLEKLDKSVIKRCHRLERGGEDDFHDARKALKAHLGAVAFLHGKSASVPLRVKLADLLGDENDIATLRSWLTSHGFTPAFTPELWTTLDHRREKLRNRALDLARKLER